MADAREVPARARVEPQLRREGARADARRVGLDDADDAVDLARRHAEARADAADGRRRRRDVGVGAEVRVEQRGVGALRQDRPVRRDAVPEERHGVPHDVLRDEAVAELPQLAELLVVRLQRRRHAAPVVRVLEGPERAEPLDEDVVRPDEVAEPQPVAVHLRGVGRPDAALRRAQRPRAPAPLLVLDHAVDDAVRVEQHVGARRHD